MEFDESGWHDLDRRLQGVEAPAEHCTVLIEHLLDRLVGHFGADSVECHSGKNDPRRHTMREVAAASIAHLAPLVNHVPPHTLRFLIETGELGSPQPPPWDDHWRSQQRTASWRS